MDWTTNITNEKALARECEGSGKCATNKTHFSSKEVAQLRLDLDEHAAGALLPFPVRQRQATSTTETLPDKKPGTKLAAMLREFLNGRNLNRFEAESHHDHCLHSTVSTLQNAYGILIARKSETVPCLRGRSSVRCARYWLDTAPDNISAARALLAMLEKRA